MRAISITSMVDVGRNCLGRGRIHDVQSVSVSVPDALPFDRLPVASRTSRRSTATWRKNSLHRLRRAAHHIGARRHIRHHAGLRPDPRPRADPQMACQTRLASDHDVIFQDR